MPARVPRIQPPELAELIGQDTTLVIADVRAAAMCGVPGSTTRCPAHRIGEHCAGRPRRLQALQQLADHKAAGRKPPLQSVEANGLMICFQYPPKTEGTMVCPRLHRFVWLLEAALTEEFSH